MFKIASSAQIAKSDFLPADESEMYGWMAFDHAQESCSSTAWCGK